MTKFFIQHISYLPGNPEGRDGGSSCKKAETAKNPGGSSRRT